MLVWFWLYQRRNFNIFVETHCMRLEAAVRKENVDTRELTDTIERDACNASLH